MAEVWVYAEPKHGTFPRVTFEMLAAARRMAEEAGGDVSAVVLGSGLGEVDLDPLGAAGADAVLVLDDPALDPYTTDAYAAALETLITQRQPEALLLADGQFLNLGFGVDIEVKAVDQCLNLLLGLLLVDQPAFARLVVDDDIFSNAHHRESMKCWCTMPIPSRIASFGLLILTGSPLTRISPSSGRVMP